MIALADNVKLTAKQSLFVDKFLSCLNATESALFAGYSARSARQIGSELLTNPNVKHIIEVRLAKKTAESDVSPEFVKKGVKDTIAECKNPKDKFVGYDLLAKVTGMYSTEKESPTVNLFTIIGKTPSLHQFNHPSTPMTVDLSSTTDEGTIKDIASPTTDGTPPQPPLCDNNTHSQKIAEQNSEDNICGNLEDGSIGGSKDGEEGQVDGKEGRDD